ncbi:MAG TPA: DMT family transporter [Planctomycetes bacterium]|nr:DMT family transporter [Planctomycetota bacterium]
MRDDHQGAARRRTALAALLLVTVIWGATFSWMKQALGAAEARLGPGCAFAASSLFLTLRFGVSALLLPVLVREARPLAGFTGSLFRNAGLLGALFLAGFLIQMTALDELTPAVSAFLTSLYVIFTAFLSLFSARHRRISRPLLVGVVLATLGAAFISGPPQLEFDLAEWMTVGSAFLFAFTILVTDHATRIHAPAQVSLVSFTVVALGSGALLGQALSGPSAPAPSELLALLGDRAFLVPLLLCSLLATLFALTLLNHHQRFVSPVRAATLYSLEPVWAAVISLLLGAEVANPWLLGGASALLAGNMIAEFGGKRP